MSYHYFPGIPQQLDVTTILRVSADNHGVYIHTDDGETITTMADFDAVVAAVETAATINF